MKQPNRKRKYKLSYYILIVISILMCLSFFLTIKSDTELAEYEADLAEGVDFQSDDFLVAKKGKEYNFSLVPYSILSKYSIARIDKLYYITDENGRKVTITKDMFNNLSKGDSIKVYSTDGNHFYASATEAARSGGTMSKHIVSIMLIVVPSLGVGMFICLLALRKKMINPYYMGKI